jgi:transposase-like protein
LNATPTCPRCRTTALVQESCFASSLVEFFACPSCRRQYARKPGSTLAERWPGPIGQLLYPIQFSSDPLGEIERVAALVVSQWSVERIREALHEVNLELRDPSQEVRTIIDLPAHISEQDVRAFLAGLAARLGGLIAATR